MDFVMPKKQPRQAFLPGLLKINPEN